jgi:hypothetical protein
VPAFQTSTGALLVFYGGTTRQYFDEIVAIPLQEALKELDSILGGRARAKS